MEGAGITILVIPLACCCCGSCMPATTPGELTGGRWWEAALHTGRTRRLRRAVLRSCGTDVAVLLVHWQLEPPEVTRMLAEEEPDGEAAP